MSNSIIIYKRSLELGSGTTPCSLIDFGSMTCGDTGNLSGFYASNTGNFDLDWVRWNEADLNGPGVTKIGNVNLTFSPDPIASLTVAVKKKQASATLFIPFNQDAGTYISSMAVYNDLNNNHNRDSDEAYDLFAVQVNVLPRQKIDVIEKVIDFGTVNLNQSTASKTLTFLNIGNLDLSAVMASKTAGTNNFTIVVAPNPYGAISTATAYGIASISVVVGGACPTGSYISTFTVFEDTNGNQIPDGVEASDTFQVKVMVGAKALVASPAILDVGIASPTYITAGLENASNTGPLALVSLKSLFGPLGDGFGNVIASDNIGLSIAPTIPVASNANLNVTLYIPAGTASGVYTGLQYLYEDNNSNGQWDSGEASAPFTLKVSVPKFEGVQVLLPTVDFGAMTKGTSKSVTFPCRNSGNSVLSDLKWDMKDLWYSTASITVANASFPPSVPFTAAVGALSLFNRTMTLTVPPSTVDGNYVSTSPQYFLYNDAYAPFGTRNATEAQSNFSVTVQVGTQKVWIQESSISQPGIPNTLTGNLLFHTVNSGTLLLSNLAATSTILVLTPPIVGAANISAAAAVFTPVPIGVLTAGQIRNCYWAVNVPAGASSGAYIATCTIWEDSNGDGFISTNEASDSCSLVLNIGTKRVIKVIQDPCDMGWSTENVTMQKMIEIQNVGNMALTNVKFIASEVQNITANNIPVGSINLNPSNLGPLGLGSSVFATLSVVLGLPQADGFYKEWGTGGTLGWQTVYDDYNASDSLFSLASEEYVRFELKVGVGHKAVSTPLLVDLGTQNPGGTYSKSFVATNAGPNVPLSKLKWAFQPMVGPGTISTSSVVFSPAPAAGFQINQMGTKTCFASVTVGPNELAGTYIGTSTVFEDENSDGAVQNTEASFTFNYQISINAVASLTILPAFKTVDFGKVARNTSSSFKDVGFMNTGNTPLTGFSWAFNQLSTDALIIPAPGSFTQNAFVPVSVNPGLCGTGQVKIGSIGPLQGLGVYTGLTQRISDGSLAATDICTFTLEVIPGGPQNISSGTAWQEIATSSYPLVPSGAKRYILSAFVCPGSGSAELGFMATNEIGNATRYHGLRIDLNSAVTPVGAGASSSGVLEISPSKNPNFLTTQLKWYRLYLAYDYVFDPSTASKTYIILSNTSPLTASFSVWFDGIQLEEAVYPGQTKPTVYEGGKKIISPNQRMDLKGEKQLIEW